MLVRILAIFFAFLNISGCQSFRLTQNSSNSTTFHFPVRVISFCSTSFDAEQHYDIDNKIRTQLETAEYYFGTVGFHVKFHIIDRTEVSMRFPGPDICRKVAALNPKIITIFTTSTQYLFSPKFLFLQGMSSFPWDEEAYGVFWFDPTLDDNTIMAHELSHYFGNVHYWNYLGVGAEEVDSQNPNIMNYCTVPQTELLPIQGAIMQESIKEYGGVTRFPFIIP